jgi:hypothetical protein
MGTLIEERPTTVVEPPARSRPAPAEVVVKVDGGRRRGPWWAGLLAVAVVAILLIGALGFWRGWFGLDRLFTSTTVDRSAPAILHQLRDTSTYQGASGDFSVVVDVEKDVSILPGFLAGSRVQYSGVGSVDATVDFGKLDASAVTQNADGGIVITLPHARMEPAELDPRSHVMNRDRGLFDRIGSAFVDSPTTEAPLQKAAIRKIEQAAQGSNLLAKAERNTATMVQRIAKAVGAEDVQVRFA